MPSRPERGAGVDTVDMTGKTALVTGSTSGIGRETARSLARLGARVVVHGRNKKEGNGVVDSIREKDGGEAVFVGADFSTTEAVLSFADAVREEVDRLDLLLNNAGGLFSEPRLTEDGAEYTFAVNHLAPFVLTAELLTLLRDSDGRVVVTSSNAHRRAEMRFDRLTDVEGYSPFGAYCRSKLANVMFTREVDRRLRVDGASVTVNSFHPGAVPGSGFTRNTPLPVRLGARAVSALPDPVEGLLVTTVPEGAETQVYLAASPDVADASGEHFVDLRPRVPSDEALDDEKARRLWELSRELTGTEYGLPEG